MAMSRVVRDHWWLRILICLLGTGVAGYMAYNEVTGAARWAWLGAVVPAGIIVFLWYKLIRPGKPQP